MMYTLKELEYSKLVRLHCSEILFKLEQLAKKERKIVFFTAKNNIITKSLVLTISKRRIQCKIARIKQKIKGFLKWRKKGDF